MLIETWEQAAVAGVVVLALVIAVVATRRRIKKVSARPWGVSVETADDPAMSGEEEVHARRSKILRSLVDIIETARVTLVDSKVKKSVIRVRGKDEQKPPSGHGQP
ncbi:hypothetical protein [Streptomyces sp. NBC_00467]|uniref:hypothetical protein n=1 Tax=Streptomyces sp. NBC_00467 TaxID=2975752 RepID=UPI002E177770